MRRSKVIRQSECDRRPGRLHGDGMRLRNVRGRRFARISSARRCSSSCGASRAPAGCPRSVAVRLARAHPTGADAARSRPLAARGFASRVRSRATCPGVLRRGRRRSKRTNARRVRRRDGALAVTAHDRGARGALIDVQRSAVTTILPICWFRHEGSGGPRRSLERERPGDDRLEVPGEAFVDEPLARSRRDGSP